MEAFIAFGLLSLVWFDFFQYLIQKRNRDGERNIRKIPIHDSHLTIQ